MEEYWNQFLNWINTVGRFASFQPYPGNRIAPPAEVRYANSHKIAGSRPGFPMSYDVEGIEADSNGGGLSSLMSHQQRPAKIIRYITEPGDTVYEEYPESALKYGLDYRYSRKASTKKPRGNNYKVLKRRYNTAEQLAKE